MINKNKVTITIGIPAFNEQANIKNLILSLQRQERSNFVLERIIISSDGSTDQTVKLARSIQGSKIVVINNKSRLGIAVRQNQLCQRSNSAILVLLNADILIKDKHFLEKIIRPIMTSQADLTSCDIVELPTNKFIEKVIYQSMNLKKSMFTNLKSGNNIYNCHGPVKAMSWDLYKSIKFKSAVGEDAYVYLYCLYNDFKFKFVKGTKVFYKLPDSLLDHQKQSIRFFKSKRLMEQEFGKQLVESEYRIPRLLVAKALVQSLINQPTLTLVYTVILTLMKVKTYFKASDSSAWDISKTTKVLLK